MTKLQARYPDLHFLLSFFPKKKKPLNRDEKGFSSWLHCQNLEEIEVLYLIGLFDFPLPEMIFNWLKEKQSRALVIVEDALGAFEQFPQDELFAHPQIHFQYQEEFDVEELATSFPTDHLAVYAPKKKSFDSLALIRKSAALSALYSDVLYSHHLTRNIWKNFLQVEKSFAANAWKGAFKNVPAIICGAGPSLEKVLTSLDEAKDKALIFAGGSAITALSRKGVMPHFAMALDPNEEELDRLKQSYFFEGPFLFAPRLHHQVFSTCNGPFGYLKSDTGGHFEHFLENRLNLRDPAIGPDLGEEAFSVTTLALSYAYALGCNPIIFAGVDLAYTGGVRYMGGFSAEEKTKEDPRALEKVMRRKDIFGNEVETLLKWIMESDAINAFCSAHKGTTFLNATGGGLGFKSVPNTTLAKAIEKAKTQDISARIHQEIHLNPMMLEGSQLRALYQELDESLNRCEDHIETILQTSSESGKRILAQSDLEEETAYSAFLGGIDIALTQILPRYYPSLDRNKQKMACEKAKYQELKEQINRLRRGVHG